MSLMSMWRTFCRIFSLARSERSYIDKMFIAALPLCFPCANRLCQICESKSNRRIFGQKNGLHTGLCHRHDVTRCHGMSQLWVCESLSEPNLSFLFFMLETQWRGDCGSIL
jgi:hypothetical protein